MSSSDQAEYVLGTDEAELARLGLQHRLWSDATHTAWRKCRIGPGSRVLDIGCGPGYGAFDLAQLCGGVPGVGPEGEVVGVDESAKYIAWLNEQAKQRGLRRCRGLVGDVQKLGDVVGREGQFDVAYARWVLCFVPSPGSVIAGAAKVLKRGGRLCIHDYFNYGSMTMAPRKRSHDVVVAATIKSWKDRGGDPDVVARVPGWCAEYGLKVEHLEVHQRVARPGETMWTWPATWWRIYAPKLVGMGYLSEADKDELLSDLEEAERPGATGFIVPPPMYEVIAVKE